jgi:hypothetical protein
MTWHDAIAVSASKLRKLWDSLSELRSSLCERRLERTVLRPALLPVKTAQSTKFFRQVWRHTVKSLFHWDSIGRLRVTNRGSHQLIMNRNADCTLVSFGHGFIAQYEAIHTVIRTTHGYHTSQSTLDEDGQLCVTRGAQSSTTAVVLVRIKNHKIVWKNADSNITAPGT